MNITLKSVIICFTLLLLQFPVIATQVSGKVIDENQAPMAFLTVFIKGTTIGTTTNLEGEYFLNLDAGSYELVFRFLGYKTVVTPISIGSQPITVNMTMQEEAIELETLEINADAEDPAYEMIRSAQGKRKFYLNQIKEYSCNVYIKGVQRLINAPKSILGVDITIPGAEDDSTNSGIAYLSESVSEFSFRNPDQKKERMISSKTSGKNSAFSWNSALDFDLNFYRKSIKVAPLSERNFISPIAPTAMLYYDYEFQGDFVDDNVVVNKIKVIPKRHGLPVFSGYIYLQEDTWRIHSTELKVTKEYNNINYVDSMVVKQVFLPVAPNKWVIGTQTFEYFFDFPLFKISGDGYYIGIFSDYNIKPQFSKTYFGPELSRIEDDANAKDEEYWKKNRPIKLTDIEKKDYVEKDSIAKVHASKSYLDSMDRINNRFKLINVVLGYNHKNTYEAINFTTPSLLEIIQFNTVEGWNYNVGLKISHPNKEKNKHLSFEQKFRYGVSSKRLYYKSIFYRRFNGINRKRIQLEGGTYIDQLNGNAPISPFINTLYSQLRERNFMKLYEKSYGRFIFAQELFNGVSLTSSLEYAHRKPLFNSIQKSGVDRENIEFTPNNPLVDINDPMPIFEPHQVLLFDARFRIRFKQQYYLRPGRKFYSKSKYPTLYLYYQKAIKGVFGSDVAFDFFKISIEDEIAFGLLGRSDFNVAYGGFLSNDVLPFVDFKHFMTTQTLFSNNSLSSFYNLGYYTHGTSDRFFEAHYEHHFNGFFFQKVPVLRKLKWQVVAGSHFLHTPTFKNYVEFTAGIENIFRVGRVDVAFSKKRNENFQTSLRMRIGF